MAQTVGEHTFYSSNNMVYGKAMEAAKSNALMRCCKDLGVASELWDPQVTVISMLKHSIWHDIVQCNQGHLSKCTTGRLGWMFWKWIGFFFQECSLKHPVLPCLLFGIYFSGSGDIPVQGGNKLVWCFCLTILIGVVELVFVEEWWCRQTWWGFVSRALRLLFKTRDVHHDQAYWRASDNKAAYY